jgi:hypothetical protein
LDVDRVEEEVCALEGVFVLEEGGVLLDGEAFALDEGGLGMDEEPFAEERVRLAED